MIAALADPVWWFYAFWLPSYLVIVADSTLYKCAQHGFHLSSPGLEEGGGYRPMCLCARPPYSSKTIMAGSALLMLCGICARGLPRSTTAGCVVLLFDTQLGQQHAEFAHRSF
jgi:hypothetical protein